MNCHKCNFYCYDGEYICPNCKSLLKKELPIDEYEKNLFIHKEMIELEERKKAVKIIGLSKRLFLTVLIPCQIIIGWWLSTFVKNPRRIDPYTNTARLTIIIALIFYIIILGKPSIPSGKSYMKDNEYKEGNKFNKPIALINKGDIKKSTYAVVIFLIFVLTYLCYLIFWKRMFLSSFIIWPTPKLKSFGIDKLATIIDIRYFIQSLIIAIYYEIHSIYNITDADYYLYDRLNKHKRIAASGEKNIVQI